MIQPGPSNAGVNVAPNQVTNVGGVGNVGAVGNVGTVGTVGNMGGVGNVGVGSVSAPLQRTYIWSGALEWMEKGKAPGDQQKVIKHLPCQVCWELDLLYLLLKYHLIIRHCSKLFVQITTVLLRNCISYNNYPQPFIGVKPITIRVIINLNKFKNKLN